MKNTMKYPVWIWLSITLIAFLAAFEFVDFIRNPEHVETLVAAILLAAAGARILFARK